MDWKTDNELGEPKLPGRIDMAEPWSITSAEASASKSKQRTKAGTKAQ